MNAQTAKNPMMACNFVVALPETDFPSEEPIYADSRDYGFDFDEEELVRELLPPLPAIYTDQPIPEVDTDEFDKVFQYFLS